jgi:Tol biopolymer transport system component
MIHRKIWTPGGDPSFGTVSADGRYLSYTDWSTGDLFVHDFTTSRNRRLTNKGSFAQSSAFAEESAVSRDGRHVAYSWWGTVDGKSNYELRVVSLEGSGVPESRVLVRNEDIGWLAPADWSPDGTSIAVIVSRSDRTLQLALVSAKNGSVTALKSTRWRGASEIFFSPDGKYLAFDSPTGDAQEPNDIYVLAVDGSRETPAVVNCCLQAIAASRWDFGHNRCAKAVLRAHRDSSSQNCPLSLSVSQRAARSTCVPRQASKISTSRALISIQDA